MLTFKPMLFLLQLVLMPREPSGLGRKDEQERLVSILTNTVVKQRVFVLS